MKTTLNKIIVILVTGFALINFSSCDKETDPIPNPVPVEKIWNFKIGFHVDGVPLLFDTMLYQNEAGNQYSVNKLHFYLSGFKFRKTDGAVTLSDTVIYIESNSGLADYFQLKGLEFGNYASVEFYVGLDSAHNITDALPNTTENLNMAWPDLMGGGYHFMKLEGNFLNSGTAYGFAMHLGKNPNLVSINLTRNFNIASKADTVRLNMNLNEWFKNPANYDFNIDGNYSMGSDAAMLKLATNGTDVFND